MLFCPEEVDLVLGREGHVVGILEHVVSGRWADAEELVAVGSFGDEVGALLVVFEVDCEGYQVVGRAEGGGEQLSGLVVLTDERIGHEVKHQLLPALLPPMHCRILPLPFPRNFRIVLIPVNPLGHTARPRIPPRTRNLIILLGILLPLAAPVSHRGALLADEVVYSSWVFIEMAVLVDSEVVVVAGNLLLGEGFHVVVHGERQVDWGEWQPTGAFGESAY